MREKELLKKIKQIRAGKRVRPPMEWWRAMLRQVRRQYPKYPAKRVAKIAAGIWHKYTPRQQIGIIQRIARGEDGIPNPRRRIDKEMAIKAIRGLMKKFGITKDEI